MPSLKLSDNAFGTVGLTITEAIDLDAISTSLSQLLGVDYQLDSLDLTAVTRTGLTATGIAVEGVALPESTLTVGGFANFDPQAAAAVSNFRTLRLTEATTQEEGSLDGIFFLNMDIQPGELVSSNSLSFDDQLQVFDFTGVGTGDVALSVSLNAVAPFDTGDEAFAGYQILGSDNGDEVFGFNFFGDFPVDGYTGSNQYLLGAGNDTFNGGEDVARVEAGDGDDTVFGGPGEIHAALGAGVDYFQGGAGVAFVDAGDGDDVVELNIELGADGNQVLGGPGNDLILGGPGAGDLLDGGEGNDVITGYAGGNTLLGGAGNDLLFGRFGINELNGETGNDTLYASEGEDTLAGGDGMDRFVVAEQAELWARMDVADPDLNQAFLLDFTGQVSSGSATITDFAPQDDLLFFGLSESAVSDPFANFLLEGFEDGGTFFEFADFSQQGATGYIVEDTAGTISWNNAILQVDQTDLTALTQQLDIAVFVDSSQELSVDGSFEVRYHQGSESTWNNFDVFSGLSVARQGPDGPVNGQDKINLALLGLSDRDLEGNATDSVSELLFSVIDPGLSESFSRNSLSEANLELPDFFLDPLADLYRPVHVEYIPGSQNDGIHDAMTYVDVDGDGSFHVDNDMVFLLEDIQEPVGGVDLVATDLYDAGNGSGIFIFDDSQESFWFNDAVTSQLG